jgi:SAM-dependent methyltransferase
LTISGEGDIIIRLAENDSKEVRQMRRNSMKRNGIRVLAGLLGFLAMIGSVSPQPPQSWDQYKSYDVPFVPTPMEVVEVMLTMADIKPGDLLYDLGCGDGRIVVTAAKNFGIKAIGIDIDPIRISESNKNAAENGVTDKVKFLNQNLFEADFKDATVVTMYLLTSVNRRLRPKLLAELKPGTRLVSHRFDMGEWEPDKTQSVKLFDGYDDDRAVYYWVVPANITGDWKWDVAPAGTEARHYEFTPYQKFQTFSGVVTQGSSPLPVEGATVSGDKVQFKLEEEVGGKKVFFLYEGSVKGHTITGTVREADNARARAVAWKAVRDPKTVVPLDDGREE